MSEVKDALKAPFPDADIEWRAQRSGFSKSGRPYAIMLAYVTNRAIQDRLDDTVGIENWKNTFDKAPDGGVMCGLSIRFDDDWVTKYDGAENTAMEAVKGGLSSAMKRAAVQWGIGRYLYNLDATIITPTEEKSSDTDIIVKIKKDKSDKYGETYYCKRPKLPDWALPVVHKKLPMSQLGTKIGSSITESDKSRVTYNGKPSDERPLPSENQLNKIRELSERLGLDKDAVEARVAEIETAGDAIKAIGTLQAKVNAKG